MKLTTLDKLFHHELKDLYDAEHQVVKALPKLAETAASPELVAAFENHLEQTREHITRLESVFEEIGQRPERVSCAGMKGLIEEGNKLVSEDADPIVKDAALISAAQRVEHYEMAVYGTLRTWARLLGYEESATLLDETLDEEEGTDSALTGIAQGINVGAAAGGDAGEDSESEEYETEDAGRTKSQRPAASTGQGRGRAGNGGSRGRSRQRTSKSTSRR
jgi:ferritin-like metal-binding protein YciE